MRYSFDNIIVDFVPGYYEGKVEKLHHDRWSIGRLESIIYLVFIEERRRAII